MAEDWRPTTMSHALNNYGPGSQSANTGSGHQHNNTSAGQQYINSHFYGSKSNKQGHMLSIHPPLTWSLAAGFFADPRIEEVARLRREKEGAVSAPRHFPSIATNKPRRLPPVPQFREPRYPPARYRDRAPRYLQLAIWHRRIRRMALPHPRRLPQRRALDQGQARRWQVDADKAYPTTL